MTLLKKTILLFFLLLVAGTASAETRPDRADVLRMFDLMRLDQVIDQTLDQLEQMVEQSFVQGEVSDEEHAIVQKYAQAALDRMREQDLKSVMKETMIESYSEMLTAAEVKAVSALYQVPAGQSLLKKMYALDTSEGTALTAEEKRVQEAFWASPEGQAIIQKAPQVLNQSQAALIERLNHFEPEIVRLHEEMITELKTLRMKR